MKQKVCQKCRVAKPLSEFYKDSHSADRKQARCKECHKSRWGDYSKQEGMAARRYDVEAQRKFGLRPGELVYLRKAQGNICLGCRRKTKLVVDHDHAVGRVRGLLCGNCNSALGLVGDNPVTILNLWAYLKGMI